MRQGYPNLIPSIFETLSWVLYKSENEKLGFHWRVTLRESKHGRTAPSRHFQVALTQCANKIPFSNLSQMKDLQGLKQFQVQSWWDIVGARK